MSLSGNVVKSLSRGIVPSSFFRGSNSESATTVPKAYINYIFFDEQFKYAGGGFSRVGSSGSVKDHWQTDASLQNISAPKNGYIFVYVSNESNFDVFFDNLQVIHKPGVILEETHYYPFGLQMAGISSKAAISIENKSKYNGKEEQRKEFSDGGGLEWLDYGARMYDAQVGRWFSLDPVGEKFFDMSLFNYTANNPILNIDPDGREYILHYQDQDDKQQSIHLKSWDDVEKLKDLDSKDDFLRNMYLVLNYSKGEETAEKGLKNDYQTDVFYRKNQGGTYDDKKNAIFFDPLVGMEHVNDDQLGKPNAQQVGNGKVTSPAALFLHEVGHFVNFMEQPADALYRQYKTTDKKFQNKEELRVIQLVENPFARKKADNGESPRTNHGAINTMFASPTSTTPLGKTPILLNQLRVQEQLDEVRKKNSN